MAYNTNFRQAMPGIGGPSYQGISYDIPPPLPPRNYASTSGYNSASMYPNRFGGLGYGYSGLGSGYGYGGYGGYNTYNSGYGYGSGYGNPTTDNRFIQLAEEGSRPAFESFQSVISMLQSITCMFDSTFQAVHASYASVLGVADNFSRMRSMLVSVFSSISALKGLKWLFRQILYILGLSRSNPTMDDLWSAAVNQGPAQQTGSNWPALALFAMLLAGPYLIMKLINQMKPAAEKVTWNPSEHLGKRADVLYNFNPATNSELGIRRGQIIMIAPKEFQPKAPGWVLACDQSRKTGLVPANYIMEEVNPKPTISKPDPQPSTSWAENINKTTAEPEINPKPTIAKQDPQSSTSWADDIGKTTPGPEINATNQSQAQQ